MTQAVTIPAEHREAVLNFGAVASMSLADVREKLARASNVVSHANMFYVDQIVTPRDGYGYANVGIPHRVVKTTKLERNRTGWATPAFGKQADMLLVFMTQAGEIQTIWVESFAFEAWKDDTHGVNFESRANKARSDLARLREAFAASAEPVTVSNGEQPGPSPTPGPADLDTAEPVLTPADDPNAVTEVQPSPAVDTPAPGF